jgi:signal transduction histidine kinase
VITIGARQDAADEKWLLVFVKDTGPGIAPDVQHRLFDKFVTGRVHGRGSGLGLAFCRLVVEAHGGRIWVESELGQGAVFNFTVPVVD